MCHDYNRQVLSRLGDSDSVQVSKIYWSTYVSSLAFASTHSSLASLVSTSPGSIVSCSMFSCHSLHALAHWSWTSLSLPITLHQIINWYHSSVPARPFLKAHVWIWEEEQRWLVKVSKTLLHVHKINIHLHWTQNYYSGICISSILEMIKWVKFIAYSP